MVYNKQTWADAPATTSPLSASRLNHLETQYDGVIAEAVAAPTPSKLVLRDTAGRAQFVDPAVAADAATRGYVDTAVAGLPTKAYVDAADQLALPKALVDAKGDLLVASGDNTPARLAVGADGQVLTADAAQTLGVKWATPATGGAGIPPTIVDAKGDLIAASAADAVARLAVGADGQLLTADAASPLGVKWAAGAFAPVRQTLNAQTGTAYTPVVADENKLITLSNGAATTVTLPADSAQAFPVGARVDVAQLGAGQVTFAAGSGATVNGTPGLKLRAQYAGASAYKIAANAWWLIGDLAA